MTTTPIEWTRNADGSEGKSWNPIRARNLETGGVGHYCEKVSPGCAGCYAERMQKRFRNKIRYNAADREKVELFLDERVLREPLSWRKPQNVFVCSMTDLFGGFVPDEWIDRIFAVMSLTPRHTYDVLTKRPERAYHYLGREEEARKDAIGEAGHADHEILFSGAPDCAEGFHYLDWPLPNVRLGASVENQNEANKRIGVLLRCPAALRWLSIEPLLGPVDLSVGNRLGGAECYCGDFVVGDHGPLGKDPCRVCRCKGVRTPFKREANRRIDWVVVGGESGPDARQMNVEWASFIVEQCKAAAVPVFVKQLGARPYDNRSDEPEAPPYEFFLSDSKGGDPSEWPEDLRVRQFPSPN